MNIKKGKGKEALVDALLPNNIKKEGEKVDEELIETTKKQTEHLTNITQEQKRNIRSTIKNKEKIVNEGSHEYE